MHKTAEQGPQVADDYLYKVVDALDEVAKETGKTVPQSRAELAFAAAIDFYRHLRRAQRRTTPAKSWRGGMEFIGWAGCETGCGQRRDAGLSLLASAPVRGTQSASGSAEKINLLTGLTREPNYTSSFVRSV